MADNIKLSHPLAQEALAKLKMVEEDYYKHGRRDNFHEQADQVLVELIEKMGLGEVADAYRRLRGDDDPGGRLYFYYI